MSEQEELYVVRVRGKKLSCTISVYSVLIGRNRINVRALYLRWCKNLNLTAKASKGQFEKPEVKRRGYIVTGDGIKSDPVKVEAIKQMAPPLFLKVESFIGMAGFFFYRFCIRNYAKYAPPLTALTKKKARFRWGPMEH